MTKSDRIVIRLEAEMRARLHAKASALGLDDAAFVRMLIYRDANESPAAAPAPREPRAVREVATSRQPHASRPPAEPEIGSDPNFDALGQWIGAGEDPRQPGEEFADEPRADEMDGDYDDGEPTEEVAGALLDELLTAGPSMLDEMLAATTPREPAAAPLMSSNAARRGYQARRAAPPASFGPGSRTRAIGVNDGAIGNNDFGDGRGNVLRDNMRHFGITGTRAR